MLRLSHSQLKVFESCQRQYYYNYILGLKPKEVETKWLDFGSAMHEVLEEFYGKTNEDWQNNIIEKWKKYKLDGRMDFDSFKSHVLNGIMMGLTPTAVEKKIFLQIGNFHFVMYLDIEDNVSGLIQDWKSGEYSAAKADEYKKQVICYAYGYSKVYNKYPNILRIFFNKNNKKVDFIVNENRDDENYISYGQIQAFEDYVIKTGTKIEEMKGLNEDSWTKNLSNCFFCGYKYKCLISQNDLNFKIVIKNGMCFIEGDVTPFLLEGLDKEHKFDLKDKFFIQKKVTEKNHGLRPYNYDDIGTVHLFNKVHRNFSIGLLPKVKNIIMQYGEYLNKNVKIETEDLRDQEVINKKLGTMSKVLQTPYKLRYYQQEAIESFIHSDGMGFIELGTGGGKTLLTAELIRMLDTTVLWITDRKKLLYQTKAIFENTLGIKCGIVGDSEFDLQPITVGTIQTISSRLKDSVETLKRAPLVKFLHKVNFIIVDESHHASTEQYITLFKELKNVRYRLGTTATAYRDDGQSPIMFSLLGDIIYSKKTDELIKEGFLSESECYFQVMKDGSYCRNDYNDDYDVNIMNNEKRNYYILEHAENNRDKKILILVKKVEHGQLLEAMIPGSNYLHGSLNKNIAKEYMKTFEESKAGVLIATVSILSEGVDIPSLDVVINASANKSDIKSVQILGRVLRKIDGKDKGYYFDFIDFGYFTGKHSRLRIAKLKSEGHRIIYSKDDVNLEVDASYDDFIDEDI